MKKLLAIGLIITACGYKIVRDVRSSSDSDTDPQLVKIKQEVLHIQGVQQQLSDLISSEFSTCDSNNGETQDVLIRKICNVAKAATSESQVNFLGQLSVYSNSINEKIEALNTDLDEVNAELNTLDSQITSINASLASLNTSMVSMQSAITALQTLTASITGQIASNLNIIEIGSENLSAGPIYENLLIRQDRTRVNGYVEAVSPAVAIANGGVSAVNGNNIVTVTTSSAHGLSVGSLVRMTGLSSGRGFLTADLVLDLVVLSTPTSTTFTVALLKNASSSGSLGGNNGSLTKITGRGLGTLWKTGDASDSSVRQTGFGSKNYNFIIRRKASDSSKAEVCYDKTNNSASFLTINASPENGSGNIVCK